MSTQVSLLAPISLREYIINYLERGEEHTPNKKEITVRVLMAIFGLTWGVPWTKAASGAAEIFKNYAVKLAFEKIFAAGIVVTVGADGLWLMLQAGKSFGSRSIQDQRLLPGSTPAYQYTKLGVSSVLSLLTCVPSVYASVTYNTGTAKYLSILTFLGNYGQGLFGYGLLFDRFANHRNKRNHSTSALEESKSAVLKNLNGFIRGESAFSSTNLVDQILMAPPGNPETNSSKFQCSTAQTMAQLVFTLFILASVTAVDLFLTKKFLKADINDNPGFDYATAVFCEIPGFVTTAISVFATLGRLFDAMGCKPQDPEMKLASDMYPKMMICMHIFTFLLALLAPSAAAYITYSTFGAEKHMSHGLQVSATVSMTLARLIFSNFTLSHLGKDAALAFYDLRHREDSNDPLLRRNSLIPLKRKLERAGVQCFEVNPGSFDN
jgi:hypothetical protein